jgi:hypothetical protein
VGIIVTCSSYSSVYFADSIFSHSTATIAFILVKQRPLLTAENGTSMS